MVPVMHENLFTLYHIGDVHSHTDSGFLKPTRITTITHYREHASSVSPKDTAIRRNKGVKTIFCPSCSKPVEVVTTDKTFAKFPKDLMAVDKELRRAVLSIILRRWVRLAVKILAFSGAAFFVIFLLSNAAEQSLPSLEEAFGFVLIMAAFAVVFFIITAAYFISVAVGIRRGVILDLGSAPMSLIDKVIVKSPHHLHRVVTQMNLKNAYAHKVSYMDQSFSKRTSNLSWRVGEKIFGEDDRCYIDSEFNNTVRQAE